MLKSLPFSFLLLALLFIAASCNSTKRLPEGQSLYVGAKLNTLPKKINAELKEEMKTVLTYPVPNRKIFPFGRIGVWAYLTVSKRYGQEPILFSEEIATETALLLTNRAQNYGWLDATTTFAIKTKEKKTQIEYQVNMGNMPYLINEIKLPEIQDELTKTINQSANFNLLQAKKTYRLKDLRVERDMLTKKVRDKGYYYLSAESFIFHGDTSQEAQSIDLRLELKSDLTAMQKQRYRLSKVTIFPDFDPNNIPNNPIQVSYSPFVDFQYKRSIFSKEILVNSLALRQDEYVQEQDYQNTLAKLSNLKAFSSINIRFERIADSDSLLEAKIYLTPLPKHNVQINPSLLLSSQFYNGFGISGDYLLRSAFRNGETIRFKPSYNLLFLTKNGKAEYGLNQLQTLKNSIEFEKPLLRKNNNTQQSLRLASTYDLLAFTIDDPNVFIKVFQHRIGAEGGFIQRKSNKTAWSKLINPISVNYQQTNFIPSGLKEALYEELPQDTSLLIFAPQIEFTPNMLFVYDGQKSDNNSFNFLREKIRLKIGGYILPEEITEQIGKPLVYQLTNELDLRRYHRINKELTFANRLLLFMGIPLTQNSQQQFRSNELYSVGGGNSLRAFSPRTIGPGSIPNDAAASVLSILNSTGNILLEWNSEWRYKLNSKFETALFTDIGNVWTTPIVTKDEGTFQLNRFYKELGVGAGIGFRATLFSLITLRLDIAAPLHNPSKPFGSRWISNDYQFNQTRFNFAFGQAF